MTPRSRDRRSNRVAAPVTGLAALLAVAAVLPAQTSLSSSERAMPSVRPVAMSVVLPAVPGSLPADLEPLADYVAQRYCSPSAKPGTEAFRALLLTTYPGSASDGIARTCSVGGTSEHKEGRAFDWHVPTSDSARHAEATALLDWLLADDAAGNPAAMARRFGVMYMIYDRQIWSAYRGDAGWRPYTGADPHTSHVHFSFSWPGAQEQTSWWTGTVFAGAETAPSELAGAPTSAPPAEPAAGPTTPSSVLREGMNGADVKVLQTLLGITADGAFGPATRDAVVAFQSSAGLGADGIVGPATWAALDARAAAPAAPTAPAAPAPAAPAPAAPAPAAPAPAAVPLSVLQVGARGDDVATLQTMLGITSDGDFGPGTRSAVVAFQQRHLLAADGIVGRATWQALAAGQPPAAPVPAQPAPKPAPVPAPVPSPSASPVLTIPSTVLKVGARGGEVVTLQTMLGTTADGIFGPGTSAAVVAFQGRSRLAADGIVGPATWAALVAAGSPAAPAAPTAPAKPAAPSPAPPPTASPVGGSQVPVAGTTSPLLRQGSSGAAVVALQKLLGVAADGQFGPATRHAVLDFQMRHLLAADGVVGPATWSALRA